MDPAVLDVIRFLLGIVVAGCVAYFAIPPSDDDLRKDHAWGEHRTRVFGCPDCHKP